MKKTTVFTIAFLIVVAVYATTGIKVSKPGIGDNVYHGSTNGYMIKWVVTGEVHEFVKIRLFDKTGNTQIYKISEKTKSADEQFLWPKNMIDNTNYGDYVIMVKTLDNDDWDTSGVFHVKKKAGTYVDISKIKDKLYPNIINIEILKPSAGKYWDEGKSYEIEWKNTLTKNKSIKIDLYNSSGTTFKQYIKTIIPVGNTIYPGNTSKTLWTIPAGTAKLFSNGWRIKISRIDSPSISGLSEKFYIRKSGSVKTYKIYAKTLNKYRFHLWKSDSEKFISSVPEKADPGAGKTRTGYENHFFESGSDWYKGYIYRSHVFFDLSNISGFVQSAKLYFNKYSGQNCSLKIYSINKSWTDIFKVDADYLPNLNNLKSYVQGWVNYKNTNFGLLFMGNNESYTHNDNKCVTLCDNIYLELEVYK